MEKRLNTFFSLLSQLAAFLFGGYGAFELAGFLRDTYSWPAVLTSILGLVLFCLVAAGVFIVPESRERALRDELRRGKQFLTPIMRAHQEGTPAEKEMLNQIIAKYSGVPR